MGVLVSLFRQKALGRGKLTDLPPKAKIIYRKSILSCYHEHTLVNNDSLGD